MHGREMQHVNHTVIPNDQLRQLASLLSSSAQILEQLLSNDPNDGVQRHLNIDLEKQLEDDFGAPDGPSMRGGDDGEFATLRTSNDINAEEDRTAQMWKDIMGDEQKRCVYEQLAAAFINLEPRRDLDEIRFQNLYPILLSSFYSYSAPTTVFDVGPLLALLKRRRQRLSPEHLLLDSSDVSPYSLGTVLDDCFKESMNQMSQKMEEVTIGAALEKCHQKNAMAPIFSRKMAMEQVETVLATVQLVNLTTPRALDQPRMYNSRTALSKLSIKQALDLFTQDVSAKEDNLPRNMNISFRSQDLYIPTIRDIGGLSIEWTDYLDRHLELDVDSMTLYVFWFGSTYFCDCPGWWNTGRALSDKTTRKYQGVQPEIIFDKLMDALALSFSILFRRPTIIGSENPVGAYDSMPVPWWVQDFYAALRQSGNHDKYSNMGELLRREAYWPRDVYHQGSSSHIPTDYPAPPAQMSFSRLGPFEDRVRILDAYMKSKKPNTLRGLWRDKRDSLQWWTLWVVIIVGGLSLIIGFFGLALATAQTVAAFRQLES